MSRPKKSIKITDHFTRTFANVIFCITCTYCKKLYNGETGRRLGDRFREHLRDIERNDKDATKPAARHFNLPNDSKQHMAVCSLSLHLGSSESRKTIEQKFIFQIGTLNPHSIGKKRFSFNQFILVFSSPYSHNSVAPFSAYKPTHSTHNSSNCSEEGLTLKTSAFKLLTEANLRYQPG